MKSTFLNNVLTLFPEGHISSANAVAVEKDIFSLIDQYKPVELMIDAENLDYISSAGLRIILKLRKMFRAMKVINVSTDVYEIFSVTGFTELVTVEKAYRRFDVTGCEMIGEGANGKVYRYNGDTIVKVYKDAAALDDIKREQELSRTAFLLGIPTAISFDVVKVGDTYGTVFELLNAKSFSELMKEDADNLEFCVSESIRIAKTIHSTKTPGGLPRQSDEAKHWVGMVVPYFTPEQNQKLKALIDDLPEYEYLIHGDYHFKNIMRNNEDTLLIDMDTLCTGHPIYELAFMFNAYKGFGLVDKASIENFFDLPVELTYKIWQRSLQLYFDTDDQDYLDMIEYKAAIIGYLRIMRRVIRMGNDETPDGKRLVETCHDKLAELLERVDTLSF